jgi:hypothetical protein
LLVLDLVVLIVISRDGIVIPVRDKIKNGCKTTRSRTSNDEQDDDEDDRAHQDDEETASLSSLGYPRTGMTMRTMRDGMPDGGRWQTYDDGARLRRWERT